MEKICKKCNTSKNLDEFSKHSGMSDGHLNTCKVCKSEYDKKRREEKKDEINKKQRESYDNNIESRREANRNSYARYKKKRLEKAKEYRDSHKEYYKDYFVKHHQKMKDDEDYNLKRRLVKYKYRERKFDLSDGTVTVYELKELRVSQQDKCGYCNVELSSLASKDVHLDHIVPLSLGGEHSINNLVYTCASCNLRKNNTHPDDFGYPNVSQN